MLGLEQTQDGACKMTFPFTGISIYLLEWRVQHAGGQGPAKIARGRASDVRMAVSHMRGGGWTRPETSRPILRVATGMGAGRGAPECVEEIAEFP